jgi:hypothetical protein
MLLRQGYPKFQECELCHGNPNSTGWNVMNFRVVIIVIELEYEGQLWITEIDETYCQLSMNVVLVLLNVNMLLFWLLRTINKIVGGSEAGRRPADREARKRPCFVHF